MANDNKPVKVQSHLTHREEAAYRMHLQAKEPPLAPSLQGELFELYLKGTTLEQIARVNKGLRLGAIVRAHEEGDWFNRRELYVQGILDGIRSKVQQSLAESADFLTDYVAVAHKLYGDKFKRFLQTGDESELGDMKPTNIGQYKMILELLLKATGQGDKKTVSVTGEVNHQVNSMPTASLLSGPMTPEQSMQALLALHGVSQKPTKDEP